jgi:hypothetical protein
MGKMTGRFGRRLRVSGTKSNNLAMVRILTAGYNVVLPRLNRSAMKCWPGIDRGLCMMKESYERYVIPVDLVNTDYRKERRSLKRPALRGVATFPVELDEATVREMLKVQNEKPNL